MKFQDPTEKGETPGYYLPFAKPYLHPKDGCANEHCWHARLPEVRQRNVWSNGFCPASSVTARSAGVQGRHYSNG
jgi:hypothetical protein